MFKAISKQQKNWEKHASSFVSWTDFFSIEIKVFLNKTKNLSGPLLVVSGGVFRVQDIFKILLYRCGNGVRVLLSPWRWEIDRLIIYLFMISLNHMKLRKFECLFQRHYVITYNYSLSWFWDLCQASWYHLGARAVSY